MRRSRLFTLLAVACVALIAMLSLPRAANATVFSPPHQGAKVTLNEESIDGPAITPIYSPKTAIAWTGIDPAHHLNIMTSTDGLTYKNKVILNDYSLWRPALTFIDSGRGDPYGTIVVAWTGTDAAHSLNLAFISTPSMTVTKKLTFWGNSSFTAPDVATINGDVNSDVYLAWAGTDSGHTIHLLHYQTTPGTYSTAILTGFGSESRPNINADTSSGQAKLLLSWLGRDNRLHFATSADRMHWTMPSASPLAEWSTWSPCMIGFLASNMPMHWLAWTGAFGDTAHLVNVMYSESFPSWSVAGNKTVLDETSIAGPELSMYGTYQKLLVGWTGTDALHHINVAVISVTM